MKLWDKAGTSTAEQVELFTVGNDRVFDAMLAPYDVQGNKAQAHMLQDMGIITPQENEQLQQALDEISIQVTQPGFALPQGVEDIHSYVEFLLTEKVGEAGKKIHTGRSRNDQVALDIKLYLRAQIKEIATGVQQTFNVLLQQAEAYKHCLMPGYTHLQLAMPSSAGLWLSAYAESLVDDIEMLKAAYAIVNKNPLGSGAGYGSAFRLNRQLTTQLLGFDTLNVNSMYAQMTRGKAEKAVATAMGYVAATLSRLAYDACLYLNQNFGFISFPDELTTGSSIMPHKKNPDVFELIRAKCNRIQALPNELTLLINNLPGGYHRDMQLTKEMLFPAIEELKACLRMMVLMMENLQVKPNILDDERYKYLFTVDAMNELVNQGMPYREAYRQVGNAVNSGSFSYQPGQLNHVHMGSIGNLGLAQIAAAMQAAIQPILP